MKAITLLTSVLVSGFLLTGVVEKLVHWGAFVLLLMKNPLVVSGWEGAIGGGVIAVETLVAVLLLPPASRRVGLLLGAVLFGVFSVVVGLLLWLAPATGCGCAIFAGLDKPTVRHLVLNILVSFLCAYLTATGFRRSPADGDMRPPRASCATPSSTINHRSAP